MVCGSCGANIADKAIVCYRCGAPTAAPARAAAAGSAPGASWLWVLAWLLVTVAAAVSFHLLTTEPWKTVAGLAGAVAALTAARSAVRLLMRRP